MAIRMIRWKRLPELIRSSSVWALKSFYSSAGSIYPLIIHLQGPANSRVRWFGEQTLQALSSSEDVTYLALTYIISAQGSIDRSGITARHYAGMTRRFLTEEGIPQLIRDGLLTRGRYAEEQPIGR